jgi:glycosyltransferase involved in cell wall biosynthesis
MMFLPPIRIPDPTDGKLDHPGPGYMFEEDTVGFHGWVAFDSGAPLARVEGWLDDTSIGRARISLPRPDVAARKDIPLADLSGFDLASEIDLLPEEVKAGARELRVVATSTAGERFEFEPVPIFLRARAWVTDPPPPAPTPPVRLTDSAGPRVLVFTHQLTLGGAQLYLLDLLRELRQTHSLDLSVVSVMDGPLRKELDRLGIPVHVTPMAPFEKPAAHLGRIGELSSWLRRGGFDVAFINTATSGASYGAEVARELGIPAIWAIHESFPPGILWADLRKKVREYTEATLTEARFGIFEADATRRIFEPLIGAERCMTIPYGVDTKPIERARAELDRSKARREAGISPDERILLCVGTIEPRKAQVPLAQAFSMVADRYPDTRLVFVGTRKDRHTQDLEEVVVESSAKDRIDLIKITPDVQTWYGIADLLVCASDVESLPRTVLEAMLWETPVLATNVFGLPDLIDDGVTGWLCEARDITALADGLDRALTASAAERERIATAAKSVVEDRHDLPRYAERILETLQGAVGDPTPRTRSSR